MRTRKYSKREIERILSDNGWRLVRQKGSHKIYVNDKSEHMAVRFKRQNAMVMRRLIKENDLVVG